MTDTNPSPVPGQHDTAAYRFPTGTPTLDPAGYPPASYAPSGYQEADYWAARYRTQRTRTRIASAIAAVAVLGSVAAGTVAWKAVTTNPLASAAEQLAQGLGQGGGLDGLVPEGDAPQSPDGTTPKDTAPDGTSPQLPESLRSLGAALGITDLNDLIDRAVDMGLVSAEDADKLRAFVPQTPQDAPADPGAEG